MEEGGRQESPWLLKERREPVFFALRLGRASSCERGVYLKEPHIEQGEADSDEKPGEAGQEHPHEEKLSILGLFSCLDGECFGQHVSCP